MELRERSFIQIVLPQKYELRNLNFELISLENTVLKVGYAAVWQFGLQMKCLSI